MIRHLKNSNTIFKAIAVCTITLFSAISHPTHGEVQKKIKTLDALIERALSRSELIYAQKQEVQEKLWAGKQAGAWMNPELSFEGGPNVDGGSSGSIASIRVTQPFYYPGKQKLRREIVEMSRRMASLSLEELKLAIRFDVIRLVYAYKVSISKAQHLQERIVRFNLVRAYMRSRPFISPRRRAERNIVFNALAVLKKDLLNLEAQRKVIWTALNVYLDYPAPVKIDVPWFKNGLQLQLSSLIERALNSSIALKRGEFSVMQAKAEKRLAEQFAYPNFSVSAFYGQETGSSRQTYYGAGATFMLPLWNRNSSGTKSLTARVRSRRARASFVRRLIIQKIRGRHQEYETLRKVLQALPVSLIKSVDHRLKIADRGFRQGRIDLLTYLELESQSNETHLAVFNSQFEFIKIYTLLLTLSNSTDFRQGE